MSRDEIEIFDHTHSEIRRKQSGSLLPKNTVAKVKHAICSMEFWGAFREVKLGINSNLMKLYVFLVLDGRG